MLLILHSLGPVPAKGKEQSTVGQSLTLVCAGTYEGTRYFKQIKQESLRGVLDEEFKGIIIEKDAVKKDLLDKCRKAFFEEQKEISLDSIDVVGLLDQGYKGYWNQKVQSLNQMSSAISPLKFQGATYFSFLTQKQRESIEQKNEAVSAFLLSDKAEVFNNFDGDKKGQVSYFKLAKYFATLAYTHDTTDHLLTENTWFNEIIVPESFGLSGKLYLGAIPLVDMKDPKRNYLVAVAKCNRQSPKYSL
ncbi:MAG: hypothetical protein HRU09_07555 [Oligoflexales bacterium]|nr:hypothetical protein [Oligoflexales bacterium]